jgi:hypothetical protein
MGAAGVSTVGRKLEEKRSREERAGIKSLFETFSRNE